MGIRLPKCSLHAPTGQAYVRIAGKFHYLGEHDSEDSRKRYDEVVGKLLKGTLNPSHFKVTVAQLCIAYVQHARMYYRKNGRETSEVPSIQGSLRPLVKLHGRCRVSEFGPIRLKQVRDSMVEAGIVRKSVNRRIGRIKRMFKWGVENELISGEVLASVNAVAGLRLGRSSSFTIIRVVRFPVSRTSEGPMEFSRVSWAPSGGFLLDHSESGCPRILTVA